MFTQKAFNTWITIQLSTAVNVLCGIVIARTVLPPEFGKFSTVLAIITIMLALANPAASELSRFVAKSSPAKLPRTLLVFTALAAFAGLALFLYSMEERGLLPILCALSTFALAVYSTFSGAILNGLELVSRYGAAQLGSALFKLALLIIFLNEGSSYLLPVFSYLAGYLLFAVMAARYLAAHEGPEQKNFDQRLNPHVIAGFFFLSLPFGSDQVLVHKFINELSGNYAAAASYAKVIMLLSAPGLLMSYTRLINTEKSLDVLLLARRHIIAVAALAATAALFMSLFKGYLFPLLLGPKYNHLTPYLNQLIIAMSCHAVAFAIIQPLLSLEKRFATLFMILPVFIQVFLIAGLMPDTLDRLCSYILAAFLAQLLFAAVAFALVFSREARKT